MSGRLDNFEARLQALEAFVAGTKRDQAKLTKLTPAIGGIDEAALQAAAGETQVAEPDPGDAGQAKSEPAKTASSRAKSTA